MTTFLSLNDGDRSGVPFASRPKFDFSFDFDRYVEWKLGHADGAA
jgi:hypothetical protein